MHHRCGRQRWQCTGQAPQPLVRRGAWGCTRALVAQALPQHALVLVPVPVPPLPPHGPALRLPLPPPSLTHASVLQEPGKVHKARVDVPVDANPDVNWVGTWPQHGWQGWGTRAQRPAVTSGKATLTAVVHASSQASSPGLRAALSRTWRRAPTLACCCVARARRATAVLYVGVGWWG